MRHLNVQTKPLHSYLCLKRDYAVLCFSKFKGINHLLKKKKTHYKWSEENNFSVIFETVITKKKIRFVLKRQQMQYLLLKFRYSEKTTNF